MGKKQRTALVDELNAVPADARRVNIATGRYIGEGFDDERLDTLFLAMPSSWKGTLQRYVGRLGRLRGVTPLLEVTPGSGNGALPCMVSGQSINTISAASS